MCYQNFVNLYREEYPTYYQYRKAIKEYRDGGYFIARCYGGVMCFLYRNDYETWKNQK